MRGPNMLVSNMHLVVRRSCWSFFIYVITPSTQLREMTRWNLVSLDLTNYLILSFFHYRSYLNRIQRTLGSFSPTSSSFLSLTVECLKTMALVERLCLRSSPSFVGRVTTRTSPITVESQHVPPPPLSGESLTYVKYEARDKYEVWGWAQTPNKNGFPEFNS